MPAEWSWANNDNMIPQGQVVVDHVQEAGVWRFETTWPQPRKADSTKEMDHKSIMPDADVTKFVRVVNQFFRWHL